MLSAAEAKKIADQANYDSTSYVIQNISASITKAAKQGLSIVNVSSIMKTLREDQKTSLRNMIQKDGYRVSVDKGHDQRDNSSWETWTISW